MFKHVTFWILSLLSFSAFSSNVGDISQQELLEANTNSVVIVDVRTPEEFQQGHVPNAINVPLSNIIDNPAILRILALASIIRNFDLSESNENDQGQIKAYAHAFN